MFFPSLQANVSLNYTQYHLVMQLHCFSEHHKELSMTLPRSFGFGYGRATIHSEICARVCDFSRCITPL